MRPLLWIAVGLIVGIFSRWWWPTSTECPRCEPISSQDESAELAMLRLENRMLVAMVKAGLSGDISAHIKAFKTMSDQAGLNPQANVEIKPTSAQSHDKEVETLANREYANQLFARLERADKKLQKQALAEGWGTGERLVQERLVLWQQARRQLSPIDYMAALHHAKRPNVLIIESFGARAEAKLKGAKAGDLIWRIDGERVLTRQEYRQQLNTMGDEVERVFELRRGQQTVTVTIANPKNTISIIADSVAAFE